MQTGGPTVTVSNATVVSPTFTAPGSPTVITFTLTVTDSKGLTSVPDTVVITVSDSAITGLSATSNSPTVLGQSTAFTATISAGSNVTYTWGFGDGGTGIGATISHTYTVAGSYTATVTATNSLGSVQAQTVVTVTNAAPIAAGTDQSVVVSATVT